jgi:predicted RecA/RadA family phage recombinase
VGQEQPPRGIESEAVANFRRTLDADLQALNADRVRAGDVDETPLRAGDSGSEFLEATVRVPRELAQQIQEGQYPNVSMGTSVAREPGGHMYCAICGPDQPCRGHNYTAEDRVTRMMERTMRDMGSNMDQAMRRFGEATQRFGQSARWVSESVTMMNQTVMLMDSVGRIQTGAPVTLASSGQVREAIPGEPVVGHALEGVDSGGNIRIVMLGRELPTPPPIAAEKHIDRKLTELGREPPKLPEPKNAWQRLVEDDTLDE